MTAPVEYLAIELPPSASSSELKSELSALVNKGLVRILDVVCVTVDDDGELTTIEFDEDDAKELGIDSDQEGLLKVDDLSYVAEAVDPGSMVAVVVFEDLWAKDMADAVERSGGEVLEGIRIPRDLVTAAMSESASA